MWNKPRLLNAIADLLILSAAPRTADELALLPQAEALAYRAADGGDGPALTQHSGQRIIAPAARHRGQGGVCSVEAENEAVVIFEAGSPVAGLERQRRGIDTIGLERIQPRGKTVHGRGDGGKQGRDPAQMGQRRLRRGLQRQQIIEQRGLWCRNRRSRCIFDQRGRTGGDLFGRAQASVSPPCWWPSSRPPGAGGWGGCGKAMWGLR